MTAPFRNERRAESAGSGPQRTSTNTFIVIADRKTRKVVEACGQNGEAAELEREGIKNMLQQMGKHDHKKPSQ